MLRIRYTNTAKAELQEIAAYLESVADAAIARSVVKHIRARVQTLAHNGLRHRERSEFGVGRRLLHARDYIVFYRVVDDVVFVQRIIHGARHITPELLDD